MVARVSGVRLPLAAAWLCWAVTTLPACHADRSDAAIGVTVELGQELRADCVRVFALPEGGGERTTEALRLSGQRTLKVAIFRSAELDGTISIGARGYVGDDCASAAPNEESAQVEATFVDGKATQVTVTLEQVPAALDRDHDGWRAASAGGLDCDDARAAANPVATEACDNGHDDDCDGLSDCAEAFCANAVCSDGNPCTHSERCTGGSCGQGTAESCDVSPGECFALPGTCDPQQGGCTYVVRTGEACASGTCRADGTCVDVTVETDCTNGLDDDTNGLTDCADPDCNDIACDDDNACTTGELCQSGACGGGSAVSCTAQECMTTTGACEPATGCVFTPTPDAPCTNGFCSSAGVCVPPFDYAPANFDPLAYPPAIRGGSYTLDCGISTFDSTPDAGTPFGNWCGQTPPQIFPLPQSNGVTAVVLPMRGLVLNNSHALELRGTRPVILAVYGDASISGHLSAGATLDEPGPGGNGATCGSSSGSAGLSAGDTHGGGGGGGFGTAGADGGMGYQGGAPGGGGAAAQNADALVPLRGGCAGGRGGGLGGLPGAGGGAVQLSAAGTLTVNGWISARGGGGGGGTLEREGGGGGGSGGAILLEGRSASFGTTAIVSATGGGGGEGCALTSNGDTGDNGYFQSASAAAGGSNGSMSGGNGGDGAYVGTPAQTGAAGANNNSAPGGGGGGGGGLGRIRINALNGCTLGQNASFRAVTTSTGQLCP